MHADIVWNFLEHSSFVERLTDCLENYTKRELQWKIVHFKDLWRQL